jgi:hypothetical protein
MTPQSVETQAASIAAQLAQELELPPGNAWERNIAELIADDLRRYPAEEVKTSWRGGLGLS